MEFNDIINEKICINCETDTEAKILINYAINQGFKPHCDVKGLGMIGAWDMYKENTCYCFIDYNNRNYIKNNIIGIEIYDCIEYSNISYFESNNYTIINFKNLII